jgi:hypothetical protein
MGTKDQTSVNKTMTERYTKIFTVMDHMEGATDDEERKHLHKGWTGDVTKTKGNWIDPSVEDCIF